MAEKEEPKEEEKPQPEQQKYPVEERLKGLITEGQRIEGSIKGYAERIEKLTTENLLGGQAQAAAPEKPKEETPQEYKDRVMKGGLNEPSAAAKAEAAAFKSEASKKP